MAGLFERRNRQMEDMMKELDKDVPGARARAGGSAKAGEPLSRPKITPGADPTYDATGKRKRD